MEPLLHAFPTNITTRYHVSTGIFSIMSVPAFLGNALVLFIVFRSTAFRDLSTLLVTYLCLADILYILYTAIYIAIQHLHVTLPHHICSLMIYTEAHLRVVASSTFLVIGLNWYSAAFYPVLCYKIHQMRFIGTRCFTATWVLSLVINAGVPALVCNNYTAEKSEGFFAYSLCVFLVVFLIPVVLEIILYVKNIKKIKGELEDPTKSQVLSNYNRKITKVLALLSVVFFLFTAPFVLYPVLSHAGLNISPFAIYVLRILSCVPCFVNPACHYMISVKFQDELTMLFCGQEAVLQSRARREVTDKHIAPEAYSANRGIFDPRTPSWQQGKEYWNRELIYGEYTSIVEPSYSKRNQKKNAGKRMDDDVRDVARRTSSKKSRGSSKKGAKPEVRVAESEGKSEAGFTENVAGKSAQKLTMISEASFETKPCPKTEKKKPPKLQITSEISKEKRSVSSSNSWPRRRPPVSRNTVMSATQLVTPLTREELLAPPSPDTPPATKSPIARSKSFPCRPTPGRVPKIELTSTSQWDSSTGSPVKVTKTKKKELHVHWSFCEEETTIETYF